jgi:hypothetical protein
MVMPAVTVKVIAETATAEAGLETVESKLRGVDATARKAGAGLRGARSPMTQLGTATRNTGHHTANLTAQFNDIGVMLAAGQSPLTLAMQQGTQISQVFQTMGGGVRGSLKAVGSGIMAMVSPMALLTIGTIAGGAALFQWATRASEADEVAEALTERLEKAREASLSLTDSLRALRLGVDENDIVLMDNLVAAMTELARITKVIEENRSGSTGREQIAEAQMVVDLAQEELDLYRRQVAEKERLTNHARDLSDQERQLGVQMQEVTIQTQETLNIIELMKDGISASTVQAMQLAGVDMDVPITSAANEAARLAENLGISYRAALDMALLQARGPSSYLRGGRSAGAGGQEVVSRTAMRDEFLDQLDPDRNKPTGGRGGSRQTPEEKRQADLEFLIESLKTEAETVSEWHQTAMENLDSANAQELTILGGHQAAKERLEAEHQRRLAGMQTGYQGDSLTQAATFFGDMESAMQNGSEKMLRIAKVFGAAQSLINSYKAYTAVLADPMLPWFARIPAAIGVLSAGIGMVSAIKGVSAGGGGSAAGAARSSPPLVGGGGGEGSPSINRSLTLIGDRGFSREQIEQIIELSNEGQDNGIRLRGRR